jgi:hypothetical protein
MNTPAESQQDLNKSTRRKEQSKQQQHQKYTQSLPITQLTEGDYYNAMNVKFKKILGFIDFKELVSF